MTRILLLLVAGLAMGVVLWSSWRVDRRLFAGLALAAGVAMAALMLQLFDSGEDTWEPLPADQIRLTLEDQHVTESGVRLTGTLENRGNRPVGRVMARVQVVECGQEPPCRVLAEAPFDLRLQVPPRKSYPFHHMIRMTVTPEVEKHEWRVQVKSVYGYRR
jgi:hypothetical protein